MARLLHEILDETAERVPKKTAIVTNEGSRTYEELRDQSRRLAGFLRKKGVARGDRIAIILSGGFHVVTTIFAASRLGAIFVVQSDQARSYMLNYVLEDADPAVTIATKEVLCREGIRVPGDTVTIEDDWNSVISELSEIGSLETISNDPVSLIYTSGSTSRPKAVISTHGSVLFAMSAILDRLDYREADTVACLLPFSFDYGLYQIFLSCRVGATLLVGSDRDVGPTLLGMLRQWEVSVLPVVPTIAHALLILLRRSHIDLPHLRMITNTGALLPASYIEELGSLLPCCHVYIMFGLTECKRVSILSPADYGQKPGSIGKPLQDTECTIIADDGSVCELGQVGELVVRGPHVMSGYWRAPELTATRFRVWGEGLERVLFTGDMCSLDRDGFLYFHGRSDGIYKQRGFRVSTFEVEAAALDTPGVSEAAVLLSTERNEAVLVVVTYKSEHEVMRELRHRLEDSKLPTSVVVVDSMPLNFNGKIDKVVLKARLQQKQSW